MSKCLLFVKRVVYFRLAVDVDITGCGWEGDSAMN